MIRKIFVRRDEKVRAGWRLALFLVILWALLFAATALLSIYGGYPVSSALEQGEVNPLLFLLIEEVVSLGCALLAIGFMYWKFEKRPFREFGYDFGQRWGRLLLKGFLLGALLNVFWFVSLCGIVRPGIVSSGLAPFRILQYSALYLSIFLPVAFLEEAVFRGYLLRVGMEGVGRWPAILGVSALFGISHLKNANADWLGALNITLWGIFLSSLCLRTRSLWAVSGIHWSYNFFEAFVFSAPVSGVLLENRLFVIDFAGPRWLTGGDFGPEASVLSIVMLLAAMGIARLGFASESAT